MIRGKIAALKGWKILFIVALLNLLLIIFIYQSVFKLEFQGDGWQYAWGHHVYYKNVFSEESIKGMRSSLAGASLTFGLIENNLGLNAQVFYTISVILKFLSVLVFYLLIKKLTGNSLSALVASLILSATFAGVEATHWVFNMYAFIGLIFVMLSIYTGLDQPVNYRFKKWLVSFLLACAGVWYATMRTNGIIPLILVWSLYKVITLKSRDSIKNLISWIIGLSVFILIDKFVLGQMESDYSSKYIIGAGLEAFKSQIVVNKFDFLLSPATNLGSIILPDTVWAFINFPKLFSLLGSTIFRFAIFPSFLIFTIFSSVIISLFTKKGDKNLLLSSKFILIFLLGLVWTMIVFLISKLGPLNFSSWVNLVMALFGGYFMITCIFFLTLKELPGNLKDLFFFSFFWSFLFLLLPLFQNGGVIFGTQQRYMVTSAPSVALFMGGLLTLVFRFKNQFAKVLVLGLALFMILSHATQTKAFFDHKAAVHSREISDRIWHQLLKMIPNKPSYRDDPPAMFFISADNSLDSETLFESLYFGLGFRLGVDYNWRPDHLNNLYNRDNYSVLVRDVKQNPKLLDDFYAGMVKDQNLIDITQEIKEKLASDTQK